jgi:hypothetical protein
LGESFYLWLEDLPTIGNLLYLHLEKQEVRNELFLYQLSSIRDPQDLFCLYDQYSLSDTYFLEEDNRQFRILYEDDQEILQEA